MYTKDNINGLSFRVHHSILNMINQDDDFLYKLEYLPDLHTCLVKWTEKDNLIHSAAYELKDVLNYLNSGDWIASPLADALSALQEVCKGVGTFITDKAKQYGLTYDEVEKAYYELDIDSSKDAKQEFDFKLKELAANKNTFNLIKLDFEIVKIAGEQYDKGNITGAQYHNLVNLTLNNPK